jgi:hypothetical protein
LCCGTYNGVAIVAELALETRRCSHICTPDREGVVVYLPHVLEGNRPKGPGTSLLKKYDLKYSFES